LNEILNPEPELRFFHGKEVELARVEKVWVELLMDRFDLATHAWPLREQQAMVVTPMHKNCVVELLHAEIAGDGFGLDQL